jgi:chromosomal replication initiator protein
MQQTDIKNTNYIALPGLKPGVKFYGSKSAESIIETVILFLGVKKDSLKEKSRLRHIVEARQISMFLIKKHTNLSLTEIGNLFGGRDHTTSIHSINKVQDMIDTEPQFKQRLLLIENRL